jgi:hypothetical protein
MTHIFQNIRHVSIITIFLFCAIFLFWFCRKFFKDPELKNFILGSLRDPVTKVGSGKSLTAMMFSIVIAISTIFAVVYSPSHLLPDYFLIAILSFIAALYGIKMAGGKFVNGTNGNNGNGNDTNNINTNAPVTDVNNDVKKDDAQPTQ